MKFCHVPELDQDGEEGNVEGPPGVGDGGEPRPELRGNSLAVSELNSWNKLIATVYCAKLAF